MNINKKSQKKHKGGGVMLVGFYSYFVIFFMFYVFYQIIFKENKHLKYYTDLILEKDNFKFFTIGLLLSYILVFSI